MSLPAAARQALGVSPSACAASRASSASNGLGAASAVAASVTGACFSALTVLSRYCSPGGVTLKYSIPSVKELQLFAGMPAYECHPSKPAHPFIAGALHSSSAKWACAGLWKEAQNSCCTSADTTGVKACFVTADLASLTCVVAWSQTGKFGDVNVKDVSSQARQIVQQVFPVALSDGSSPSVSATEAALWKERAERDRAISMAALDTLTSEGLLPSSAYQECVQSICDERLQETQDTFERLSVVYSLAKARNVVRLCCSIDEICCPAVAHLGHSPSFSGIWSELKIYNNRQDGWQEGVQNLCKLSAQEQGLELAQSALRRCIQLHGFEECHAVGMSCVQTENTVAGTMSYLCTVVDSVVGIPVRTTASTALSAMLQCLELLLKPGSPILDAGRCNVEPCPVTQILSDATTSGRPKFVLSGSFAPVHSQHVAMMRAGACMQQRHSRTRTPASDEAAGFSEVWAEIALRNADKGLIATEEGLARAEYLLRNCEDVVDGVYLTWRPYFSDKSLLPPLHDVVWLMGADTLCRVSDPKYYGGVGAMAKALDGVRIVAFDRVPSQPFALDPNTRRLLALAARGDIHTMVADGTNLLGDGVKPVSSTAIRAAAGEEMSIFQSLRQAWGSLTCEPSSKAHTWREGAAKQLGDCLSTSVAADEQMNVVVAIQRSTICEGQLSARVLLADGTQVAAFV